jgi:hypothetical protein
MTTKTSEKTIVRIKDLIEQPAETRFLLLPGGLDRVIIACNYYEILEGVITVYMDEKLEPIFAAPVANGFVIVDRQLTDRESMAELMKRMYADEKEAQDIHDELTKGDEAHAKLHAHEKGGDNVRHLHPMPPVPAADGPKPPPTGQYL